MYVCTGILDAESIVMRFTWIYKESAATDKEEIEWSDISESDSEKSSSDTVSTRFISRSARKNHKPCRRNRIPLR